MLCPRMCNIHVCCKSHNCSSMICSRAMAPFMHHSFAQVCPVKLQQVFGSLQRMLHGAHTFRSCTSCRRADQAHVHHQAHMPECSTCCHVCLITVDQRSCWQVVPSWRVLITHEWRGSAVAVDAASAEWPNTSYSCLGSARQPFTRCDLS